MNMHSKSVDDLKDTVEGYCEHILELLDDVVAGIKALHKTRRTPTGSHIKGRK